MPDKCQECGDEMAINEYGLICTACRDDGFAEQECIHQFLDWQGFCVDCNEQVGLAGSTLQGE